MRVKHLDELYSWKQIRKLDVIHEFNPNQDFIPIAIYAPRAGCTSHYGGGDEYYEWYGRRKAHYAKQLWEMARIQLATQEKKALAFEIVEASECFNTLRFKYPTLKQSYCTTFKQCLESLANEGRIKSALGRLPIRPYPWSKTKRYEEIVIADDAEYNPYRSHRPEHDPTIAPYTECEAPSWDDVKHYFIELTEDDLAFLHGDTIINKKPTELDQTLFDACTTFDVKRVKALLKQGANPNAIKNNDSLLAQTIDELAFSHSKNIKKFEVILDLLLAYGCDINLGAYCSFAPLYQNPHLGPALTKLLLQKGANPNVVSWIAIGEVLVTPLDHTLDDINAYGEDPELLEVYDIIHNAGGKFFDELVPDFYDD